ncbi:MAG: hypothetical protein EO766_12230 [Hydrotalea sp. AMD]|uniref:hypothetical protein n=1 Tax=Hydrotalea sp. AMD TaxID=2501297 RepID=UPI001025C04B|nr:hypothetical protein [Hydrotalea sp. AMD]RWZ87285.1 MAG: hypothetical protein EO766_12230 [Hydrotalea sp. AMD]
MNSNNDITVVDKLIKILKNCQITTFHRSRGSVKLSHSLEDTAFYQMARSATSELALLPQNNDWMPGTPTGDKTDFGLYVYEPNHDGGDTLDILITPDAIHWC